MHIIERESKVREIIKDDEIEKVQFFFNSDHHFGIRIVKKDGKELLITLTAMQTTELFMFMRKLFSIRADIGGYG